MMPVFHSSGKVFRFRYLNISIRCGVNHLHHVSNICGVNVICSYLSFILLILNTFFNFSPIDILRKCFLVIVACSCPKVPKFRFRSLCVSLTYSFISVVVDNIIFYGFIVYKGYKFCFIIVKIIAT